MIFTVSWLVCSYVDSVQCVYEEGYDMRHAELTASSELWCGQGIVIQTGLR